MSEPQIIMAIVEGELVGYIRLGDRWYKMSPRMVSDRWLRDNVLRQQASELEQAETENKRLRTELLYKQVLEKYNRAHGQNRKITLKQICEQMGVSYDAVRTYRSRERKRKNKK